MCGTQSEPSGLHGIFLVILRMCLVSFGSCPLGVPSQNNHCDLAMFRIKKNATVGYRSRINISCVNISKGKVISSIWHTEVQLWVQSQPTIWTNSDHDTSRLRPDLRLHPPPIFCVVHRLLWTKKRLGKFRANAELGGVDAVTQKTTREWWWIHFIDAWSCPKLIWWKGPQRVFTNNLISKDKERRKIGLLLQRDICWRRARDISKDTV